MEKTSLADMLFIFHRLSNASAHSISWDVVGHWRSIEAPKHQKSTSFIMKTLLRTIRDQRKVRELPRKMNVEEVEEPKKHENYHANTDKTVERRSAQDLMYRQQGQSMHGALKLLVLNTYRIRLL